MSISDNII